MMGTVCRTTPRSMCSQRWGCFTAVSNSLDSFQSCRPNRNDLRCPTILQKHASSQLTSFPHAQQPYSTGSRETPRRVTQRIAALPKRIYRTVGIRQSKNVNLNGVRTPSSSPVYDVMVDEKPLRTPNGNGLSIPSYSAAVCVAAEWESQLGSVDAHLMPLTSIVATAIDEKEIASIPNRLISFLETDTVRFRSEEGSTERHEEDQILDPICDDFVESKFVCSDENVTPTSDYRLIMPIVSHLTTPPLCDSFKGSVLKRLMSLSNFELISLQIATGYLKSLVLGIQVTNGRITPVAAVKASMCEERSQRQRWGVMKGLHDVDDQSTLMWVSACSLITEVIKVNEFEDHSLVQS